MLLNIKSNKLVVENVQAINILIDSILNIHFKPSFQTWLYIAMASSWQHEVTVDDLVEGLFPFILRFLFVICGKMVKSMILILAEIISVV
jgi:hypothetical protein